MFEKLSKKILETLGKISKKISNKFKEISEIFRENLNCCGTLQ